MMGRFAVLISVFVVLGVLSFGAYSGYQEYERQQELTEKLEYERSVAEEISSSSLGGLVGDFAIPQGSIDAPPPPPRRASRLPSGSSVGSGSSASSPGVPSTPSSGVLSNLEVPREPVYAGPPPPEGFDVEDLSPFFNQVGVISVKAPDSQYDDTLLVLRSSSSVSLSGWRVKTDLGNLRIPEGIRDYAPGSSKSEAIVLKPKETLSFFGNYPFTYDHVFQKHILLNACTGYLNDVYEFRPELPRECKKVQKSEIEAFSDECQSFILSLDTCEVPSSQEVGSFWSDFRCQDFMRERFGYAVCYEDHREDSAFFSDKWYAWAEKQLPFSKGGGRVLLLDSDELLVDEFVY